MKGIVRRIFQQTGNMIPEFQSDEDAVNQLGLELRRKATKGMSYCFSILYRFLWKRLLMHQLRGNNVILRYFPLFGLLLIHIQIWSSLAFLKMLFYLLHCMGVNQTQNVGPILLVLDDVWSGAEAFIENFQFEIEGYKILVTSRSVFLRFNSTYTLTRLNREDAMRLFLRAAELHDGDTDIRKEIAEKVLLEILIRLNCITCYSICSCIAP